MRDSVAAADHAAPAATATVRRRIDDETCGPSARIHRCRGLRMNIAGVTRLHMCKNHYPWSTPSITNLLP